jgi:WD40 repeat protein
VAFSPDGTKALTGSQDGAARIWDVESGKQIHMLVHGNAVGDVAFSPNGTMTLTGCFDGTARIWDVSSGQEVHRIDGLGSVIAVAFSSDGDKVLIGSSAAWIWPVSDQDLISDACNCIAANFTQEKWERYRISDPRTCPREGRLDNSSDPLSELSNNLKRLITGSPKCEPCIARMTQNRE